KLPDSGFMPAKHRRGPSRLLRAAPLVALLCGCSAAKQTPRMAQLRGQDQEAILSPTQPDCTTPANCTVSGIFRQSRVGHNVEVAHLVPGVNFFGKNSTMAMEAKAGYTLMDVDVDASSGQHVYSGVFESGVPSTQYVELVPSEFQAKVSA